MTNTTDTYWDVDGVSLQTFAQNIETLGSRDVPPKYRGDDITIPYMEGQLWVPKVPDSRIIPLGMWVRGANSDDSVDRDARRIYDDNWRNLQRLLFTPGRQFTLTKRFWYNGTLHTASAKAEFNDGLDPTMSGRTLSKFTVSLKLADPWFYETTLQTVTLVNGDQNVTVAGDVPTRNIIASINGVRTNPRILNRTTGAQFTFAGSLLAGDTFSADVKAYRATKTPSGGSAGKVNGSMIHSGDPQWLNLIPGVNVMNLSSDGTELGITQLQIRGAYL